jgi:hypothetical protein
MTFGERIEAWHRMRYPRDVTEHVTAAMLLGISSPRLEKELRVYWGEPEPKPADPAASWRTKRRAFA